MGRTVQGFLVLAFGSRRLPVAPGSAEPPLRHVGAPAGASAPTPPPDLRASRPPRRTSGSRPKPNMMLGKMDPITVVPGVLSAAFSWSTNSSLVVVIGGADVCTLATNAHLVSRLLVEKNKRKHNQTQAKQ